jgi:hypothetical protein
MLDPSLLPFEARTGATITEKCSERLDIPVPEKLYDAISALAGMTGRTKAEYARMVLEQHAFGLLEYGRSRLGAGG